MIDGKRKGSSFSGGGPVHRSHSALSSWPKGLSYSEGGFTLIELLAVVAIMMLLVALLLPSLKGARDSARTAQCASNLRQVAQGCLLYAGDSDSVFPAYWAAPCCNIWQALVGTRYLNESTDFTIYESRAGILRSTMHCPSDTSDTPFYIPNLPIRCIAINGTMMPDFTPPGFNGWVWPEAIGATMRRLSRIRYPEQLCLVGDGGSGTYTTEWGSGARFFMSVPADVDINVRHKGGMNCAFVDGHAEWKTAAWVKNELPLDGLSKFFDWRCRY